MTRHFTSPFIRSLCLSFFLLSFGQSFILRPKTTCLPPSFLSSSTDEAGKFVPITTLPSSSSSTLPPLIILFDSPPSVVETVQRQLPPGANFCVAVQTPNDSNLTVEGVIQRVRGYLNMMHPTPPNSTTTIFSVPSLPSPPSSFSPSSPPVCFFSSFEPEEVSATIARLRPLNLDLAFAVEVPPALPKSLEYLLSEIRDDHREANKFPTEERDYDIAIGVGVSIAGFVGAYGWETFRLWKEGALYLPPPFDSLHG
mmetsp:Transcript_24153/g.50369  ORF Transcript_24153/g.50369 Transcript_24153/m.50369 type:complete len:255 (-) Transcript_24153:36-800(-)